MVITIWHGPRGDLSELFAMMGSEVDDRIRKQVYRLIRRSTGRKDRTASRISVVIYWTVDDGIDDSKSTVAFF
jgi:hypothetical protein